MRLRLVTLAAVALAVLGTTGAARASCVELSAAEQRARAAVIVDGVILAGAKPGDTRLRVSRYVKGSGPDELAIVGGGGAGVVSSVDIVPAPGERWRIFGALRGARTVFTTVCDGSARLAELEPPEPVVPASTASPAPADPGDGAPMWPAVVSAAVVLTGVLAALYRGAEARCRAWSTVAATARGE